MPSSEFTSESEIFAPVELPCGRTMVNRLVKVAMYEHLALLRGGPPNKHHFSLYSTWSKYNWGMVMTGNVQVSPSHLSLGRDIIIPSEITPETLQPFKRLASIMHGGESGSDGNGTLAIVQLSHAGRQSPNFVGGRNLFRSPLSPSPIRLGSSKRTTVMADIVHHILFPRPREMTQDDIEDVVSQFVRGAQVSLEAGFDGIELHAAHGYLIACFLSEEANIRTDEYSSAPDNSLRLLERVVTGIRSVVPKTFVVGLKLNSSDYMDGTSGPEEIRKHRQEERALEHLRTISSWGSVDFIEISGGSYEKPDFATSQSHRQAFFSQFTQKAVSELSAPASGGPAPLIMLTGGLRTAQQCQEIISQKRAQLLGFARLAALCPGLPEILQATDTSRAQELLVQEPDIRPASYPFIPRVPVVGAGVNTAWYNVALRKLGTDYRAGKDGPFLRDAPRRKGDPDYTLGALGGLFMMWFWICTQ